MMLRPNLFTSCSRISRFVVNFSTRRRKEWFDDEDIFLDEEPVLPSRADIASMTKKERAFLKQKIIQKKSFPAVREAAMLTWEAMEQMRFLNKEFPEEWTLDRIVESFPVSRPAAIKILRSKRPRLSQDAIDRHDLRVQKNLEALKHGDVEGNERLENTLKSLMGSNKMSLLSNSGGLKGFPMPTSEPSYLNDPKELSFEEQLKQLRVNPFTSILAKYNRLESESLKQQDEEENKVMLEPPKLRNQEKERHDFDTYSKFKNLKKSCGSSGNGITLGSRSDFLPRTKFDESSRSVVGNVPSDGDNSQRLKSEDGPKLEYGDLPRREYGDSSRTFHGISQKSQIEDLPKSRQLDLRPGANASVRLGYDNSSISQPSAHTDFESGLPSLTDIGSDNIENLNSGNEEVSTAHSNNSSTKRYLSRKEKKQLKESKAQQLPNFKSWDEMALYGTGKK
ncbi:neugrin-like [Ylistrum balloti]|uniref:neugrin-like n=1 Tax=Ylistrum balloti TaxID=509963 RepID=UPI002905D079|nr:neugrin-like [Ylistrum balloti]